VSCAIFFLCALAGGGNNHRANYVSNSATTLNTGSATIVSKPRVLHGLPDSRGYGDVPGLVHSSRMHEQFGDGRLLTVSLLARADCIRVMITH
jgi:hypothetical protein